MTKRLLAVILLFICLVFGDTSYAQSQFNPVITKIENSLFGMAYSNQNDEARLKRIEQVVYGSPSSSSVSQRVSKLSKDLNADTMGQEIKPKKDTFAEDEDSYKSDIPKADSSVNYPIVNKLEDQVFKKEFKTQDINKRLANLEQKTFNRVYSDDLNSRVERLKGAIMKESSNIASADDDEFIQKPQQVPLRFGFGHQTGAASPSVYPDPSEESQSDLLSDDDLKSQGNYFGPSYNQNNSVLDSYDGDNSIGIPLAGLEQSILKKSFPDDTVQNRLTRMEEKLFNSNFVQDDPETRLDRISSAYQAKKSAKKYDSNRAAQHVSTAVQLGAILLMVLAFVL